MPRPSSSSPVTHAAAPRPEQRPAAPRQDRRTIHCLATAPRVTTGSLARTDTRPGGRTGHREHSFGPRIATVFALLAAESSHRCLAGRARRWPARMPHPRRASRTPCRGPPSRLAPPLTPCAGPVPAPTRRHRRPRSTSHPAMEPSLRIRLHPTTAHLHRPTHGPELQRVVAAGEVRLAPASAMNAASCRPPPAHLRRRERMS